MTAFEHDVVAAVLVHDGRALLCHRHPDREWFPDVWDVPGGHVDADESATDALGRELREELGIQIAQVASEPSATFSDGSELRIRVWAIDRWHGRVENRAPDEHDAIRWCSPEEIDGLDLADPRLADVVREAIRHADDSTNASRVRRHLTIVLSEPEVAKIAALRRRWDPVMAAGIPPHVTVVYPEETADFGELVDRARQVVPGFGAFEVRLGEATTIDGGTGGVFIAVYDDGQSFRSLRERLVPSSTELLNLEPHLTIAHPRTTPDGPACWEHLSGWSADLRLQIETVSYTETSLRSGMRIVETYRL